MAQPPKGVPPPSGISIYCPKGNPQPSAPTGAVKLQNPRGVSPRQTSARRAVNPHARKGVSMGATTTLGTAGTVKLENLRGKSPVEPRAPRGRQPSRPQGVKKSAFRRIFYLSALAAYPFSAASTARPTRFLWPVLASMLLTWKLTVLREMWRVSAISW